MTGAVRRYAVFGLIIASEIELPELLPSQSGKAPDVEILATHQAEASMPAGVREIEGGAILCEPGIAQYCVTGGDLIQVFAYPAAAQTNVRLFLLGSAMGLLLHQRGLLPLHASAVELDGKAVAFLGGSGAGKSTLATWFHDRGERVLADDVCVIDMRDEADAKVQPGLARFRLWRDALLASGRSPDGLARSYAGDERYDKWDLPVGEGLKAVSATRLAGIYLLDRGDFFGIARLRGIDAMEALFANTYRGEFVGKGASAERHWRQCRDLLAAAPMFRITRTFRPEAMRSENEALQAHALALDGDEHFPDNRSLSSQRM